MGRVPTLAPRVAPLKARPLAQPAPPAYGQGRGGRPWRRKRDAVLKRDGYLCKCDECQAQGRLLLAHEVDHVVPLAEGGSDDESNLRAINRDCHAAKSAADAARGRNASGSR
ncbi:HNH endonuclease [Lysobacter enzymogenes]|uniref:HNH endonuclease n=1 Tax=Lysobacter enzymogenes TaxID=69 RepID=UPI0008959879|nr:HNH endonuclease signature motif containing protein [Lysobacter enzymogenes]SDW94603.1 HNH endonuclease [Lysobacter enzymogenes]